MARYLGKETPRIDGVAKVTGKAKYAAEFHVPHVACGFIVLGTVAKGRISAIDTREAERTPGVIRVFTHLNAPKLGPAQISPGPVQWSWVLQSDRIFFNGQPVALVVAETYEQARHAARLVNVSYDAEKHVTDTETVLERARPDSDAAQSAPRGNPVAAMQAAAVKIEAQYRIPIEHHNPSRLHQDTDVHRAWLPAIHRPEDRSER